MLMAPEQGQRDAYAVRLAAALVVLAVLCLASGRPLNAAERHLSVIWNSPSISLDVRDAPLIDVVKEIGARVGFSVVAIGAADRSITASLHGVTVDEALRQLLRAESYTEMWREGPAGQAVLDKIVLLGGGRNTDTAARTVYSQPPVYSPPPVVRRESEPVDRGPTAPGPLPSSGDLVRQNALNAPVHDPAIGVATSGTHAGQGVTVEEVLRNHALPGSTPGPVAVGSPNGPATAGTQGLDESLAIASRLAQQNLKALIEGLDAATRSLSGSPSPLLK